MALENNAHQYPLYNTTFTLYRTSPLYVGDANIDNLGLQQHARRFRDILTGDVLRGVRVGLGSEDDTLARVGALQTVVWQTLKVETIWAIDDSPGLAPNESILDAERNHGIILEVSYEKATYTAILLRATAEADADDPIRKRPQDKDGFLRLPLMLTRMPLSLRETFIDYISMAFDTRVSALKLDGGHLTTTFENFVSNLIIEHSSMANGRSNDLQRIIKEVQISIGFDMPGGSSALKVVDIHIAREDLPRMLTRGKKLTKDESPFIAALKIYIKTHLALDLGHARVKIVKIACGAFVLGEGKLKLTQLSVGDEDGQQQRAARQFINGLVDIAKGESLVG